MASYRGHLAFASVLGAGYGGAGVWYLNADWGRAFLGATLTTIGGLLPDLDSDSGVPVRELFGAAAAIVPFFMVPSLHQKHLTSEQMIVVMAAAYLLIRYVLSALFKHLTVHRGMFHSIPALLIAGVAVFLLFRDRDIGKVDRLYFAGAVALGFLSHLVLDELYSVDFMGVRLKLNKYAGSALKLASPSWIATAFTYVLLLGLGYLAWLEWRA
jgi:hypothetical protein